MSKVYVANTDGTISMNEQPQSNGACDNKIVFENALHYDGWYFDLVEDKPGLHLYNASCGEDIFDLYVYIKSVRSSSRGRSLEHRIQLNSNISPDGFINMNQESKVCLVLGVYTNSNKTIICAWDPVKKNNRGKQKSCYIDIKTIANAMRDGFAKRTDNAGDIVYAFEPQFLRYYIKNINEFHSGFGE